MKLLSLILLMTFIPIGQGFSQEQPDKVVAYKAWVHTLEDTKLKGLLFTANENEIVITDGFKSKKDKLIHIPYQNIEIIKLQRQRLSIKKIILGDLYTKTSNEKIKFYINGSEVDFKNQLVNLKNHCLVRDQPETDINEL